MKSRTYIVFILLLLIFVLLFSNYYINTNIEGIETIDTLPHCPIDYRLDINNNLCIPLVKSYMMTDNTECPKYCDTSGNKCILLEVTPECMSEKYKYVNGKCILTDLSENTSPPPKPQCDEGYYYAGAFKECVSDPVEPINGNDCPPNTVFKHNICRRPNKTPFCTDGYTYKSGECVNE